MVSFEILIVFKKSSENVKKINLKLAMQRQQLFLYMANGVGFSFFFFFYFYFFWGGGIKFCFVYWYDHLSFLIIEVSYNSVCVGLARSYLRAVFIMVMFFSNLFTAYSLSLYEI